MKAYWLAAMLLSVSGFASAYTLDQACYFNDLDQVKVLVETKAADVNAEGPGGWTPLFTCAQGGYLDILEYLVSKGADVNHVSQDGLTVLLVAAGSWEDSAEMIDFLVDHGASINARDKKNRTALILSLAQTPKAAVAQELVKKGADVNVRDTAQQWTALNYAVAAGSLELVKLLVGAGADVSPPSSVPSPFSVARTHYDATRLERFREIAQYLYERGARDAFALPPNVRDRGHPTPLDLVYAIRDDNRDDMEDLLKSGVDPNQVPAFSGEVLPFPNGGNFLHLVLDALDSSVPAADVTAMVELLLDAGADPNSVDSTGKTPLFSAARRGNADSFQLLLVKGANPNAVDNEGANCLMSFAVLDLDSPAEIAIAGLFRQFGGDLNARGPNRQTLLLLLSDRAQNLDLVQFLIAQGADVNLGDRRGETPLRRARDRGLKALADALKAAGGVMVAFDYPEDNSSAVCQAVLAGDLDALDQIPLGDLSRWLARSDRTGVPETLLHLAVETGNLAAVEHLTTRADWNVTDVYQQTPLLLAVRARQIPIVRMLVAHGADANLADAAGISSFEAAAADGDLTQVLLSGGQKPRDAQAFEAACRWGSLAAARELAPLLADPVDPQVARDCADLGRPDVLAFLLPMVSLPEEAPGLLEKAKANRQRFDAYGARKPAFPVPAAGALSSRRGYFPFVLDQYSPYNPEPARLDPASVSAGVYVPAGYSPDKPAGLMIYLSGTKPSDGEQEVLDRANLIWAGFSADAVDYDETGRSHSHELYSLGLVYALMKSFAVDPARVYLYGVSWGGRLASQILYRAPLVFRGGIADCGGQNGLWDGPKGQFVDGLAYVQRQTALVSATGDTDSSRMENFKLYGTLQAQGFERTFFLVEPRGDHAPLSEVSFEKAIGLLDAVPRE